MNDKSKMNNKELLNGIFTSNNSQKREKCYVITGGVGTGKTSLINELCKEGAYNSIPEIAAEFINEQIRINGTLLPWKSTDSFLAFEEEILLRRMEAFLLSPNDQIVFADRGIPDAIPFFMIDNLPIPEIYFRVANIFKYNKKIFFAPPWLEIYEQTITRPQTYIESVKIGKLIFETYSKLGYNIINLPKINLSERARFILGNL